MGGGPQPVPATLSFRVLWNCTTATPGFNNGAQKFRGTFKLGSAQMEWSARIGDPDFQSRPLATSSSDFGKLGHEQNGSFY